MMESTNDFIIDSISTAVQSESHEPIDERPLVQDSVIRSLVERIVK